MKWEILIKGGSVKKWLFHVLEGWQPLTYWRLWIDHHVVWIGWRCEERVQRMAVHRWIKGGTWLQVLSCEWNGQMGHVHDIRVCFGTNERGLGWNVCSWHVGVYGASNHSNFVLEWVGVTDNTCCELAIGAFKFYHMILSKHIAEKYKYW